MLIVLCAMKCEAKPVIDYFRLQKTDAPSPLHLYRNDNVCCVVSGIGHSAMRRATEWSSCLLPPHRDGVWLNLGIAGHAELPIGSLRQVAWFQWDQQRDIRLQAHVTTSHIESLPLMSFDEVQTRYPKAAMVDMEGFGFAQAVQAISAPCRWASLKVISDNHATPPTRDKNAIATLLARHMPTIDQFAQANAHQADSTHD